MNTLWLRSVKMSWFKVNKTNTDIERLYILEINIEGTIVYKVGKASGHSCKQRMLQIVGSYFDVYRCTPVVSVVRDRECIDVFKKETKCHHELKEYQHVPPKTFTGSTELFEVDKEKVIEVYERVLANK